MKGFQKTDQTINHVSPHGICKPKERITPTGVVKIRKPGKYTGAVTIRKPAKRISSVTISKPEEHTDTVNQDEIEFPLSVDTATSTIAYLRAIKITRLVDETTSEEEKAILQKEIDLLKTEYRIILGQQLLSGHYPTEEERLVVFEKVVSTYCPILRKRFE